MALIPVATAAFLWAGPHLPPAPWAWVVGILAGTVAGLTLSSYVPAPGTGRLIDVGCSPCALVGAASVVVALSLRWASPTDPGVAAVGIAILAVGLLRRLSDAATCPVPMR
jgi:hypothetical protein